MRLEKVGSLKLSALLVALAMAAVYSQPYSQEIDPRDQLLDQLSIEIDALQTEKDTGQFEAQKQHYQSEIHYYKYQDKLRNYNIRTFWWQTISSYVVLVLVVIVTTLGCYLSYREVMQVMSLGKVGPETKIDLTAQRFQLTSAITGVVILVLSLFFLYLFVDRVFQINPIELKRGTGVSAGPKEVLNKEKDDSDF